MQRTRTLESVYYMIQNIKLPVAFPGVY